MRGQRKDMRDHREKVKEGKERVERERQYRNGEVLDEIKSLLDFVIL